MNALTETREHQPVARSAPDNVDFGFSPLMNPARFDHMYRVGRMLASSALWPGHLKGKNLEEGAANGMLVLNMAERLREDPLTVAQNIYFVSGRPGWNTTYVIAKANMHGVFEGPVDWDVKGKGDTLSLTAFGIMAKSGKRVEVTCDMAMAKAEGWTKNSKYQSMPEQMLRYRSAAFLIRLYAPEVMIGVPAQIELELDRDYRDVTPRDISPIQNEIIMNALGAPAEDDQEAKKPAQRAVKRVDRTPPKPAEKPDPKEEAKEADAGDTPADAYDEETGEVMDDTPPNPVEVKSAEPEKGEPKVSAADYERLSSLSDAIMRDLEDAPSSDAVLSFYEEHLDEMKALAPDLHSAIMEAVKE